MLPPIEDSVLQNNPKFAALHASLTKKVLNPNGSSKNCPTQKERDAVKEALHSARVRATKSQLIKSAIRDLDISPPAPSSTTSKSKSSSSNLPLDLIELIILLSARLNSPPPPPSALQLLENTPQWLSLPEHLPQLSSLVSSHLLTRASALTRVQFPTTNASFLHRSIPKLVPAIQAIQLSISNQKQDLESRRVGLVNKTGMLLGLYHLASTLAILHLEQTIHGAVARNLRAKSEYLSLRAQELELEIKEKKTRGEKMVYTDEVKSALETYLYSLRDARERLKERKRENERKLWGYGVGRGAGEGGDEKEKVMRKIAEKYGELKKEVEDVRKDVERLRNGL